MVNTAMVGGVVNRNNILYYPLILCAAYALWRWAGGSKPRWPAMVVMVAIGFAGHVLASISAMQDYICDGQLFPDVAGSAGRNVGLDCDRYYLTTMDRSDGQKVMTAQVMFAHHIDYAMRAEEEELRGRDGEPNGWYFTERYVLQDFSDFEPDPMECAVYIVRQQEKTLLTRRII